MKLVVLIISLLSTHCISEAVEDSSVEGPLMDVDNAISTREIVLTVTPTSKKRDTSSEFDESVDISLDVEGEMVTKRFTRSPEYDDITMYDGDERVEVKRNWGVYSAAEGEGVIMITRDAKNRLTTEGSIIHNDQYFFVQPTKDLQHHVLHRITAKRDAIEPIPTPRIASKRRADRQYVVELLLLVDKRAKQKCEVVRQSLNSKEKTNKFLKKHLILVMADVNNRYGSLSKYGTTLKVNTTVEVIRTPFTKNLQGSKVSHYKLFDSFTEWARNQHYEHDSVLLLTGYNFQKEGVAGYAYRNGICKDFSKYGLAKFFMGLKSTVFIAHEVGHNLGMLHDDRTKCRDKDNYVMSSLLAITNDKKTAKHPWSFTSCSNQYLLRNIKEYEREQKKTSCIKFRNADTSLLDLNDQKWRYIQDYNNLCSSMKEGSTFCVDRQWRVSVQSICTRISCGDGVNCDDYVPYSGTPCGNYKVCKDGSCVEDTKLGKFMDETCPYGDRSELKFERTKITCSKAVKMSYCSYEEVQKYCCRSCAKVKRSGHICPYEDRKDRFMDGKQHGCTNFLTRKTHWCNYPDVKGPCCNKCLYIYAGCKDQSGSFHGDGTRYTVQVESRTYKCSCSKSIEMCKEMCIDRPGNFHDNNKAGCSHVKNGKYPCDEYMMKVCCITCRAIKDKCRNSSGVLHDDGTQYTVQRKHQTFECRCIKGLETCTEVCIDHPGDAIKVYSRIKGQRKEFGHKCSYARQSGFCRRHDQKICCNTCKDMKRMEARCRDRNRSFHEDGTAYTVQFRSRTYQCSCSQGLETCEELCIDRPGNVYRRDTVRCSHVRNGKVKCHEYMMKACCITCRVRTAGCKDKTGSFHEDGTTYTVNVESGTYYCSCSQSLETCEGPCVDRTDEFIRVKHHSGKVKYIYKSCKYVQQRPKLCKNRKEVKQYCCKTCKAIERTSGKRRG